jgi:hypothetical protein
MDDHRLAMDIGQGLPGRRVEAMREGMTMSGFT